MSKNYSTKICPWCGKEFPTRIARRHFLGDHGKSFEDYISETLGPDALICHYPGCTNKVGFQGWTPNKTCCHEHQLKLLGLEGKHWYQHDNRPKDENGKDLIMKGVTERGNNPFSSKNRKLDEDGRDIIAHRSMESKLLSGIVNPITYKSGFRDLDENIDSVIYLFPSKDLGYVKVGRSSDVYSRYRALSSIVNIDRDEVIGFFSNELVAADIEAAVHKEFCKSVCLDRSIVNYSEWYKIDQMKNIIKFIENFVPAVKRLGKLFP